jgi:hypothetical protein
MISHGFYIFLQKCLFYTSVQDDGFPIMGPHEFKI